MPVRPRFNPSSSGLRLGLILGRLGSNLGGQTCTFIIRPKSYMIGGRLLTLGLVGFVEFDPSLGGFDFTFLSGLAYQAYLYF